VKWEDHRSWVLGSIAAVIIAFAAAVFSVVYAGYYNRSHHIAEWGAFAFLKTPVPLWFVFLLAVVAGCLGWKVYNSGKKPRIRQVGLTNYYFVGDEGPYCQPCYDGRDKLVPLLPQKHYPRGLGRKCQVCNQHFFEECDSPKPPVQRYRTGTGWMNSWR
jgi:hypothetical protein